MLNRKIFAIRRPKIKFPVLTKKKLGGTTSTNVTKSTTISPQCSKEMTTSKFVTIQRSKAREILACLERKKIQLIAIDFDKTLLEIHTRGRYQGSLDDLLDSFRSTFYYLIDEILRSDNFGQTLHLCIVSFSSQELLIRNLFQFAFPHSKTDKILIRCNTKEFLEEIRSTIFVGKESHLASIVRQIHREHQQNIEAQRIVLFDDDMKNIFIAQEFHHQALQIADDVNLDVLLDFVCDINLSEN